MKSRVHRMIIFIIDGINYHNLYYSEIKLLVELARTASAARNIFIS